MTTYTIRYNRTTNHIAGIAESTIGSELNYSLSACGALSRNAHRLATGRTVETIEDALRIARSAGGRAICQSCETAALR